MPDGTFDSLDPLEPTLRRRRREFSDQAVVPVDAAEIARTVVRARRPRFRGLFSRSMQLGWIAAAALLVAVVAGPTLMGGTGPKPAPEPTASTMTTGTPACGDYDVDAVLVAWDGAAGSRIATVELRNLVGHPCTMWRLAQPILTAMGTPLIVGEPTSAASGTIEIGASDVLTTDVRVSNYCGPAPDADHLPVTVQLIQVNQGVYTATPLKGSGADGVPPCNGPGQPASIEMQPWTPKASQ
jgi:hypothetical protein